MPFHLPRLFTGRASRNGPTRSGQPATRGGRVGFADDEWDDRTDLLPRAIIRQVLVDAIELPPAWLRRPPADLALAGAAAGAAAAAVTSTPADSKPAKRRPPRKPADRPSSLAPSAEPAATPKAAKPSRSGATRTRTRRQPKPTEPPAAD